MKLIAEKIDLTPIGGEGLGPFGNFSAKTGQAGAVDALSAITKIVSSIVGIMTIAAGIWFIMQFLVGGIAWITAGGDKTKLTEARSRITNAFIGLIIVIAGWSILALVGQFFGYNILINPSETIQQLGI